MATPCERGSQTRWRRASRQARGAFLPAAFVQMGMWRVVLVAIVVACVPSAMAQEQAVTVARSLVPLLKDARASMQPELTVEPGNAPPSPLTGRNSTLIAITVAKRTVELPPEVDRLVDRLIAWDVREPLPATDREVVIDWVEALRAGVVERLVSRDKDAGCDDACLVAQLTEPGPLFGDSREEQVETRNALLLTALIEAAKD